MSAYDGSVRISTELDNSKLEKDIGNLAGDLEAAGKSALGFSDVLRGNLLSQAVIGGFQQLSSCVRDLAGDFIESAAAVRAENSQFEQTFGTLQNAASDAIGGVAEASGILETRLNSLGTQIYAFARSSGGSTEESMTLMGTALQAAADGAAYYDKSLEETAATLQSFLKGNYENDAALGLSATEATRNAAAMEQFGMAFNDLTEIQKQQTLLQMVLDAQKLSGAMGQAAREADGWENVQGNLTEAWRLFMANAGTAFLENLVPIIQQITTELITWTNSIDWETFGAAVTGFVNTIIDNGSTIIAVIAGIGAAFVAWNVVSLIQGVVTAISAFKAANDGLKLSQLALNAVMAANPIGIVAGLIAGLVAALIVLWNTNEDFRNAVIEIWESIKESFTQAWERIKAVWDDVKPYFEAVWDGIKAAFSAVSKVLGDFFSAAWKAVKKVWDGAGRYFETVWNTIKGVFAVVKAVLSGNFKDAWTAIKSIVSGWAKYFSGVWDDIKGVFSNAWTVFKDVGRNIVDGIKQGISGAWSSFKSWINNALSGLISFGSGADIASASAHALSGYSIPALATGTVVPPNREFMAILGDNKRETEIVSPLSTMKQAMLEAMQESGYGGEVTITVVTNLDGREVARNTVRHINNMTQQAGKPVLLI